MTTDPPSTIIPSVKELMECSCDREATTLGPGVGWVGCKGSGVGSWVGKGVGTGVGSGDDMPCSMIRDPMATQPLVDIVIFGLELQVS